MKPDNIVFANPVKLPSHISHAAEREVSLMTFDSQDELLKIKKLYPQARLVPIKQVDVFTRKISTVKV